VAKLKKSSLNRRGFLKGVAVGAAAGAAGLATTVPLASAQQQTATAVARGTAALPTADALAAEAGPLPGEVDDLTVETAGSDFMVVV